MFWIFLAFHLLVILEVCWLFKKRLKKKGMLLFIANFIMMIINLLMLKDGINATISRISYYQDFVQEHFFWFFLWLIFNIVLLLLIGFCMIYAFKKKRQNRLLAFLLILMMLFIALFFSIVLFQNAAVILVFGVMLVGFYFLIKTYLHTPNNYYLAVLLLMCIFFCYSFLTYTGAARLYIALKGYPRIAYETGLEELKYYQERNMKKYALVQNVDCKEQCMYLIEVKNYGFIKFAKQ